VDSVPADVQRRFFAEVTFAPEPPAEVASFIRAFIALSTSLLDGPLEHAVIETMQQHARKYLVT
jgi:hypothetical protein